MTSVAALPTTTPATLLLSTAAAKTGRAADGDYKTKGVGHEVKDADGDYKPSGTAPASVASTTAGSTLAAISGMKLGG